MNNSNNKTDIEKALDEVSPSEVNKNLKSNDLDSKPEPLSDEEQTPFIDDELRTDK
ncbi:hypothetical protein [Psychrobacter sp.]|uniref:hypothetical protein n=1 Tax=Psychrobacter sp. TaxID=56811 RepID=UPI0025F1D194|nr:hypothetical protein [Psychrobacter sp.]